MNGELVLCRHLSPTNVSFAFQTRANQSITNFGTTFKQGGRGDGPRLSCMNFVGLEFNYDNFNWKQAIFDEGIPKNYNKHIKVWPLLRGITLSTIWIERNDKVFNHQQRQETKFKHCIWDELIIYAKAAWEWVIKQIKINSFSAAAMLQGFDKMWGARNVLCRRNNLQISSGTGNENVGR